MKFGYRRCAAALCLLTVGCAAPAVIADLEHDKVLVQANRYTDPNRIHAEAERGCALHGRTAVPISKRSAGGYDARVLYLFACRDPKEKTADPK